MSHIRYIINNEFLHLFCIILHRKFQLGFRGALALNLRILTLCFFWHKYYRGKENNQLLFSL